MNKKSLFAALAFCLISQAFAHDFGLKINQFSEVEADAFFNVFYGGADAQNCRLNTLFVPQNRAGQMLRAWLGEGAYENLASISCGGEFLWLIFERGRLKQIKYEAAQPFEILRGQLAAKYRQLALGSYLSEGFYMDYYDEFFINSNTICGGSECAKFAIFDYSADVELLLLDAKRRSSAVILRDKMLPARMQELAKKHKIRSNSSYEY